MNVKICTVLLLAVSTIAPAQVLTTRPHAKANLKKSPQASAGSHARTVARSGGKKPALRAATRAHGLLRTTKVSYTVWRRRYRAVPIFSPEMRAAALDAVESRISSKSDHFQSAEALQPFFQRLAQSQADGTPVHILQYGDSHTASDDWADAERRIFQQNFGDGGPGFTLAGYPFKGYRRFDVSGTSSSGWTTAGTLRNLGDERNGLAGLSVTADRPGQTVTLTTSANQLELYFLQQPGGGSFTVSSEGTVIGTVSTDGPLGNGFYSIPTSSGAHTYTVETTSYAPVRLFGWVAENHRGVTWETMGINGAQAKMILDWDQNLWKEQLQRRDPALIVIAYGTNEARYPLWSADSYRTGLLALIQQFKQAVPNAALLLVGPPDCGRYRPFSSLQQVVEIQREVARKTKCAFWDWESRMDDSGGRPLWLQAGLSQADYTHLTGDGYRMLGRTIADELLEEYRSTLQQPAAQATPAVNSSDAITEQ